jgi:hypothetical protein
MEPLIIGLIASIFASLMWEYRRRRQTRKARIDRALALKAITDESIYPTEYEIHKWDVPKHLPVSKDNCDGWGSLGCDACSKEQYAECECNSQLNNGRPAA